jgi:hypothetical protein
MLHRRRSTSALPSRKSTRRQLRARCACRCATASATELPIPTNDLAGHDGARQHDAHLQIFQIGRLIYHVLAGEFVAALFEHLDQRCPCQRGIQTVGSLHGQALSGWRHEVLQRSASCRADRPSTLDLVLAGIVVLVEDADRGLRYFNKRGGQGVADVVVGHIPMMITGSGDKKPGRVGPVQGPGNDLKPSPAMPGVPTMQEAGLKKARCRFAVLVCPVRPQRPARCCQGEVRKCGHEGDGRPSCARAGWRTSTLGRISLPLRCCRSKARSGTGLSSSTRRASCRNNCAHRSTH